MMKRLLLIQIAIFSMGVIGMAQVQNGHYYLTYPATADGMSIVGKSVKHKSAKWYQENIRGGQKYDDTFDDEKQMEALENGEKVQATHTYVDTIYMKKGSTITLQIPNKYDDNMWQVSINNYYRWFNYRNDKSFNIGDMDVNGWCQDLLYSTWRIGWRFENGYVSGLLNYNTGYIEGNDATAQNQSFREMTFYYPTDDEFNNKILKGTNKGNFEDLDNSYYAVACDLSNYTDFSTVEYEPNYGYEGNESKAPAFCEENDYCEPTLSGRVVYYIIGIDDENTEVPQDLPMQFQHYWKLFTDENYQGGGNEESKKYLEEYEITYPNQRVSENTNEVITLSKEARAYAIHGETGEEALTVRFAEGQDNGLTLSGSSNDILTLSGNSRIIQFYKGASGSLWSVDNGSKATILITKTVNGKTYNIARYKLTFKRQSIPLTEAQIAALEDPQDTYWWKDMYERAPSYLREKSRLLASLDFDYGGYGDNEINTKTIYDAATGKTEAAERFNYPFPLKWSNSSYAFYDGSFDVNPYNDNTVEVTSGYTYHTGRTSWNMYGIVNYYVGNLENKAWINPWEPQYKSVKNHEGNWLYVNATDNLGKIAELDFANDLSSGSEVIVTAWVRSANAVHTYNDAGLLFTVMGVKSDGTQEPIYRDNTGQIENTGGWIYINGEENLSQDVTGKGAGTNEWYQVFFTFRVKENDVQQYDHYTVKIENASVSPQGGGYYVDEIRVYSKVTTDVNVSQIEPVRPHHDTPIKIEIGYEDLMYSMGFTPDEYDSENTESSGVDFIIINKNSYEEYINAHGESEDTKKEAIRNSIVNISYENENATKVKTQNPGAVFFRYYERNSEYDLDNAGSNFPSDGYLLRQTSTTTSEKQLTADYNAELAAETPYLLVVHATRTVDESTDINQQTISNDQLEIFAKLIGTRNAIEKEFTVTSNDYKTEYKDTNTEEITIKHRPAKWYQMREKKEYGDTFDEENQMTVINYEGKEIAIQATHAYVDTIYMHKGSSIGVISPNTLIQSWGAEGKQTWLSTTPNYYRWFDYRTDGTFYFDPENGNADLLTPDATKEVNHELTAWRFANGYVSGGAMEGGSKLFVDMEFYYPTDEEFAAAKLNNKNFTCIDNTYYIVACDLSAYTDFAETYVDG
ncbi:MAG: hypothetical protein LUC91_09420, partial [Prevotella sp.]|nr:hypothetical protein [Prevotella sp.]